MAFLFRMLGTFTLLYSAWSMYEAARVAFLRIVPSSLNAWDSVVYFAQSVGAPIYGLITALVCFGVAHLATRQDKLMRALDAARKRRAAAPAPQQRPVSFAPPDMAHRPPRMPSPNDVRDSRYQNVYVRRVPGRDVTMRVPPDNPARALQEIPEPRGRFRWSRYPEPRPNPRDPKLTAIEAPQKPPPEPPLAR